ncbi:3-isopropylmalate dehydratase small subunit [Alkalibacillus salilacus]|uniref:3-isopropylmalate dehydratase small subunit n=1 Tax=Alkalibacillus salilacus TaxID=284582 RepID=A0ABT9VB33_9BACI|nr:3-isopropylmalate dehydratase small subunit [Alkalibacillus salilacus]MDQ0158153.1 3-isopropylmalate/(R)-2-methylmalate dehydratase small subunit [Alkalibacillus salilacus]
MQPFSRFSGQTISINQTDIDTDIIIPAEFLKRIERSGFGKYMMYYWRYDSDGKVKEDFPLNQEAYENVSILVTGDNFGCGSSRENAVWALHDYGFQVIIAPSFADIFKNNCSNNGLLTIELDHETIDLLHAKSKAKPPYHLEVDIEKQVVFDHDGFEATFNIDPKVKYKLLHGLDDIDLTLLMEDKINEYESERPIYLNPST